MSAMNRGSAATNEVKTLRTALDVLAKKVWSAAVPAAGPAEPALSEAEGFPPPEPEPEPEPKPTPDFEPEPIIVALPQVGLPPEPEPPIAPTPPPPPPPPIARPP